MTAARDSAAEARGPALTAARRARDLAALGDGTVDVLVVGGGITGTGIALDAATRGMTVALVERRDLAHGTSRWSSKLVHGGLRYLATGDVGLAWESARERAVLIGRTAPHLVHALPMILPLTGDVPRKQAALAMTAYRVADLLKHAAGTSSRALPGPRRLSVTETLAYAPGLRAQGLRGGLMAWDGQLEDDARLVVAVARTAAMHGARILTRCAATALRPDGATVVDELTGTPLQIRARAVVSATGVWASELSPSVRLRPSKGAHLVVRGAAMGHPRSAVTVPVPGERNRYVLALPQPDGLVYLGLTDDPITGALPDVPLADAADRSFLLDTVNRSLGVPLTQADVVGSFAGLRPLAAGDDPSQRTADLSRRHVIDEGSGTGGVITVYGGKLTTYRRMAEDTVDVVAGRLGVTAPCRTASTPLVGAAPVAELRTVAAPARLVRRYGVEAPLVAALADDDPDLLLPVADGLPVLGVEFAFGVLQEGAITVDDLLERRTRLAMVPADAQLARPAAQRILERYGAVVPS
jgi:glycerol-3-phosphate dehydrogenase